MTLNSAVKYQNLWQFVILWRFVISHIYGYFTYEMHDCQSASYTKPELCLMGITHRVISDRVHRLLVTLSYFRPDRFVQLLSLIPILILLLYYLVSGCLTSLC